MNEFNKKIIVTSIILAFGASGSVWANPTNTATDAVNQTATADSN